MANIIHRIGIKSSAAQVYKAIATIEGLAHWWTEEVEGSENKGGNIEFIFRTDTGDIKGKMTMEVEELNKERNIRWRCVDGPPEWIGTVITFDLSVVGGQTIIIFGHRDWKEEIEFMAHCSMKWAVFLLSLREYVQTGKGKPSPHDLKIDDWN